MPFSFCTQCGTKLQPAFKFCPSCGEKLLSSDDESVPATSNSSLNLFPPPSHDAAIVGTSLFSRTETPYNKILPRPALRKTRNTLRLNKEVKFSVKDDTDNSGCKVSPVKRNTVTYKLNTKLEPIIESSSSSPSNSPQSGKRKSRLSSPTTKQTDGGKVTIDKASGTEETSVDSSSVTSPLSSPLSRSPAKGKNKAKKMKHMPAVEPLQEGEEVTDTAGKKWKLLKLLTQNTTELIYEVSPPKSKEIDHILKLGAKDGKIFTEQNFLQRAAKPASVEKWIKQNKLDFLGIPSCAGFGLHADSYRFLIFHSMGESLHSLIVEEDKLLSEKVVLQLACRILDVLQFLHSNEYVHADINAENIYIKAGQKSQVYLVGYCHAFRFCPGGQHVEYREGSRTPHEGAVEFISLDAHKGAAPSRRSDLQSLGYCMLRWHTGTLPWTGLTQPEQVATQKQRYMGDVDSLLRHCFGKRKVSGAFHSYLSTVMALQYCDQPNYSELKAGLSAALLQLGGSLEQPLSL